MVWKDDALSKIVSDEEYMYNSKESASPCNKGSYEGTRSYEDTF